jgi:phosphatidylserine decarboxylase
VHVNRSPIGGVLTSVRYQKGQYMNAMNPDSADRNEQSIATIRGKGNDAGMEVTFKQIAGLIARRIVFNLRQGETVERGQRVGLIKFGSRVNVIVPAEAVLRVKKGQRVKGGSSVLASMAELEMAPVASTARKSARASVLPGNSDGGRR